MSGFFKKAGDRFEQDFQNRKSEHNNLLTFGVRYLDDAMKGISKNDLVLVGAPSGAGKTQFCVNLSLKNAEQGKRVHFIALEAFEGEIERRILFQAVSQIYQNQLNKKILPTQLNFRSWSYREVGDALDGIEAMAHERLKNITLNTMYKPTSFGVNELVSAALDAEKETDLLIVDHIHYFDFETENENREMKEILKTIRKLNEATKIPIVLVSHLRKKDRRGAEIVAGGDEFHGSSDLVKIATKVISIGRGGPLVNSYGVPSTSVFETYFRIVKNRMDGSSIPYVGAVGFSYLNNEYGDRYRLMRLKNLGTEVEEILPTQLPYWARKD